MLVMVLLGGDCEEREGVPCVIHVVEIQAGDDTKALAARARAEGLIPHFMRIRALAEMGWEG